MKGRKGPFRPLLPDRVDHDNYQVIVKWRGVADRTVGWLVLLSGFLAVSSTLIAVLFTPLGVYTGHVYTDLVVFGFIFFTGIYFLVKGVFFIRVFLCRFCLKQVPEGSTYCPSCGADLLSNENPQDK